jgi:hypothetical protein
VLLFLSVALPFPAERAWGVIHVPGDYPTIQAGLDVAASGDTVLVAAGTYTGAGNKDLTFGGRNIVLMSELGTSQTTIDCEGAGRGFHLKDELDATAIVDGFTVTNGSAVGGGGISVWDESSPTIRNCRFIDNSATQVGGGVFVGDDSSPTFLQCAIEKNDALFGGGINLAASETARFIDCTIAENTAANRGGGVLVWADHGSLFSNCIIRGNQAGQGGAAYVEGSAVPVLTGCTITGNRATDGGGLMIVASAPSITSCTIAANHALSKGGGLYVTFSWLSPVTRTIVWSNCADVAGDQIYATGWTIVSFVCGDVDDTGVEGSGTVNYDVDTIHSNPLFCNEFLCTSAPTIEGVYTLDDDSPALATASPCGQLIGSQPEGCTGRQFEVTPAGQYTKIQDAIDHSVTDVGDTVLVDDDTWTGTRNTELNFGGRHIVLKSKGGPGQAVIDGGNAVRGIVFQNGEGNTAIVEGFTFINGASGMPGAAVLVEGGSSPVFRDCIVKQNDGTSVVCVESGSPVFESCTIEENTVPTMSGVVEFAGGNPRLESCVVRNNDSPNAVCVATSAMIVSSQITDNEGSGVYFLSTPSSLVEDTEIARNGERGVVLDASTASFNGVAFRENGAGGVIVTGLVGGQAAPSGKFRRPGDHDQRVHRLRVLRPLLGPRLGLLLRLHQRAGGRVHGDVHQLPHHRKSRHLRGRRGCDLRSRDQRRYHA